MIDKENIRRVVIGVLALVLFVPPAQAHERSRGRSRHSLPYYVSQNYPAYGKVVVRLPGNYISVVIGGRRYYHCDGVFYRRYVRNYVVVAPPHPGGSIREEIIVTAGPGGDYGKSAKDTQDVFTVYIPDSRGGYTPVTLKRSGDGFLGPQGEFYPEFPKVEQLRVMYVKAE